MYYHSVALYFTVYFKGTLFISYLDSQYYKRQMVLISFSGADGKTWAAYTFTYRATWVRIRLLGKFFFSLFKFQIPSEMHFFSIKIKEIIKHLWGRALLSQYIGIHLIIWIKILIYTQVIIAIRFIVYYNTEAQIIATIWNK